MCVLQEERWMREKPASGRSCGTIHSHTHTGLPNWQTFNSPLLYCYILPEDSAEPLLKQCGRNTPQHELLPHLYSDETPCHYISESVKGIKCQRPEIAYFLMLLFGCLTTP